MKRMFSIFLLLPLMAKLVMAQIPLGSWRDHLPYHQASRVVAGAGRIVCATPFSLFSIGIGNDEVERLSKTNGLHEVGISAIALTTNGNQLVVAYDNSNIDLLAGNKIVNIDAIKRKEIAADKRISDIYSYQGISYLCSGLGVILLDEAKAEIKDTWVIGEGGRYLPVTGFATDGKLFFAATAEGLKQAPAGNDNLADYRNWAKSPGLPAGPSRQVVVLKQQAIAQRGDSLYRFNGNAWSKFYSSGWEIKNINVSADKLLVIEQQNDLFRVSVVNEDGSLNRLVPLPPPFGAPQQAVLVNDALWVADLTGGLVQFSGGQVRRYQLNSPAAVTVGDMIYHDGAVWASSGRVTTGWQNTFSRNGLYRFQANEWTNVGPGQYPVFNALDDLVSLAAAPDGKMVWAGSFGGGLLQLNADLTSRVWKDDALIGASSSSPGRYNVSGLAFDRDRNLWISNYGAAHPLVVRKADGSWRQFTIPYSLFDNAVSSIVVDDYEQKWIISPNGNGLLCFSHGSSIDNPGDDRWKLYRAGQGNGNLPANDVLSLARDKNGFIWVGTSAGIGIIQCAQEVFANTGCEAVLPIVQQDNFAGYLFKTEAVQAIAVDDADRKWIGTKNGVWLISADGEKTISRFTADNSPLLDNDVQRITIDPQSGEIFFATVRGICSYRGTATAAVLPSSGVLAFPNPVPPGYTGTIAVRGLPANAIVKITELNGRLVFQARATGTQLAWDGKDYRGHAVASGVYLVLAAADRGQEKLVTKIVVVK